jgi:predicted nucleotidyltransferase
MPELHQNYGVVYLGAFGSYVRRQARPNSDLDLLVEFDDRPIGLFQFIRLENQLSKLLGVQVDLVEKSGLKTQIEKRVLREVVQV